MRQAVTDEELVKKLCDIESGLSNWEENFVESVASQVLDQHKTLSVPQRRVAEKILDERGG